ncbi:MAG TPA: lipoyl(octanoyl) transferase LipB [Wenzhouxiangella sp.]|nr:lipoyl(octanoyl) transferase LipB [Wenzhouxiangella sp.]
MPQQLNVIRLGRQDYAKVFQAMRAFTDQRGPETVDELWLVEHDPVFTQGLAGRSEHLLAAGSIPVIQSDRGGQVTYHGPGQLVLYPLIHLERRRLGVRCLVSELEQAVINVLADHSLTGRRREGMPGVYIRDHKIASIGLKVRKGCCYHGLSLNVAMDLSPFAMINPCGYAGLQMTQLSDCGCDISLERAGVEMVSALCGLLDYYPVWSDAIRDEN